MSIFTRVSCMNPFPFLKHVCLLTLMVMAATAASLQAQNTQSSKPQSPGFEKMKTLVGKWEGKLERSNGETVHLRTQYRVIGGGVSIVEDWIEDDEPMITVYHDKRGNLSAVHYCALAMPRHSTCRVWTRVKSPLPLTPSVGWTPKKNVS